MSTDCGICYNDIVDSPKCHQCKKEVCDTCYHKITKCPHCRYEFPLVSRWFIEAEREYYDECYEWKTTEKINKIQDLFIGFSDYLAFIEDGRASEGLYYFMAIFNFIAKCPQIHTTRLREIERIFFAMGANELRNRENCPPEKLEMFEYYLLVRDYLYYLAILIEYLQTNDMITNSKADALSLLISRIEKFIWVSDLSERHLLTDIRLEEIEAQFRIIIQ